MACCGKLGTATSGSGWTDASIFEAVACSARALSLFERSPSTLFTDEDAHATITVDSTNPKHGINFMAPKIFTKLGDLWEIDNHELCSEWTRDAEHAVKSGISEGRSGALMIQSIHQRFIAKTIGEVEVNVLLGILPSLVSYLETNLQTRLMKLVMLLELSKKNDEEPAFVLVFSNVFAPAPKAPIEIWDIKGRAPKPKHFETYSTAQAKQMNPEKTLVGKDNSICRHFELTEVDRTSLLGQLNGDSAYLAEHRLMDYSTLIGVVRLNGQKCSEEERTELRQDVNVLHSADNQEAYMIGIIDILTVYNGKKRAANLIKRVLWPSKSLSTVPANTFRNRQVRFLATIFVSHEEEKEEMSLS